MNRPSYKELEKRVAFLEQEIKTKLRQKDVLIQDINEGVAAKTGESFFETIVLKLSKALRSDYTFVGKLLPDENKVETISLCVDNSIVDNFSYDIKGTPCENVIGAKICTYAANVFSSFPDDLLLRDMEVEGYVGIPLFNSQNKPMGIMVALFKNEIEDTSYVEQIMEIFSSRTGAELERYATEEALRESEIIFKSIFHNSGIGIALVNMDGKIIKANRTVEKMYSDKIGKLTGKNFTDIVHHDDAEETKAQFMKIVSGEIDEIKAERKYVSKNGAVVFVNLNARVVKDYSGSPNFIVAFIEDITERKLAEEKLKQSEQKLAFHFEETPIGIIEWNSNFEVVSWNKAAENIFGYSKEEATGRHSIGLILPEKTWPEIENIWDSLSGKTGGIRNINENLTKEGKTILCDWYNTAMIDEQGNTIGMASMVIDITEQKQIEDQLKKLTTAVEQSANTVVITDLEGNIEYVNKKFTET
ncbi:MAG: PAS domain S-box protein, partial [Cyclobacteriaceae bacterium]|nr:PAS domain S-box protein [Cyclobacteriaceae bacterium]